MIMLSGQHGLDNPSTYLWFNGGAMSNPGLLGFRWIDKTGAQNLVPR